MGNRAGTAAAQYTHIEGPEYDSANPAEGARVSSLLTCPNTPHRRCLHVVLDGNPCRTFGGSRRCVVVVFYLLDELRRIRAWGKMRVKVASYWRDAYSAIDVCDH